MGLGGSHRPTNYPWERSSEANGEIPAQPGGFVTDYLAAAALNIGDAVFISGALNGQPQVNKSVTLAQYTASACGIVVGGAALDDKVLQYKDVNALPQDPRTTNYVGTQAIAGGSPNDKVLVASSGICLVKTDGTNVGALAVGQKVTASATVAGAVTATGQAAQNTLGILLDPVAITTATVVRLLVTLM